MSTQPVRVAAVAKRDVALSVEPDFDFGSDAYRDLYERSTCTAFQYPDWLQSFYRLLVGRGVSPWVVTGRDSTGALQLVAPLIRRRSGGTTTIEYAFLGVTDY